MKTKKQPIDGSKCKHLTLEEAKNLKHGDIVYFRLENDSRGALKKVRVTGKVKTWKRSPEKVQVPWKYGFYNHNSGYITETNLENWTLEDEPFARFKNVRVCPATGQEWMLVEYTWDFLSQNLLLGQDDLHSLITELTTEVIKQTSEGKEFTMSYELYEVLPSRMQQFAPEGYFYGCHPADGEWGYWPVQEEE